VTHLKLQKNKQTGDITHQHIVNVLLSNITFL